MIIVVVGVVAVVIGRSSDSSSSAAGGGPSPSGGTVVPNGDLADPTVTVQGTALTKLPSSGTDPAVGESIPTITGETFDGSGITISPADGPQVIMVIAHWCPHCRAEVPRLQDWLDQNGMPTDVKLTAIATANDKSAVNYPASDWLRGAGWSVPTILDDAEPGRGARRRDERLPVLRGGRRPGQGRVPHQRRAHHAPVGAAPRRGPDGPGAGRRLTQAAGPS